MEYLNHLLKKVGGDIDHFSPVIDVIEMATNNQDIQNITKKLSRLFDDMEGEIAVFSFHNKRPEILYSKGDAVYFEDTIHKNRRFFQSFKDDNSPLFNHSISPEHYFDFIFPISDKSEVLGGILLKNKESLTKDDSENIYSFTCTMSLILKHYNLVDKDKMSNIKDPITQLYNLRNLQHQMQLEIDKSNRYQTPLSMIVFEIKDFKMINDKLGFSSGDRILKDISSIIESSTRLEVDMPARISENRFAVVFVNTDILGAYTVLSRILFQMKRYRFEHNNQKIKIDLLSSAIEKTKDHVNTDDLMEDAITKLKKEDPISVVQKIESISRK